MNGSLIVTRVWYCKDKKSNEQTSMDSTGKGWAVERIKRFTIKERFGCEASLRSPLRLVSFFKEKRCVEEL